MLHQDLSSTVIQGQNGRLNSVYLKAALQDLLGKIRWNCTFRNDCAFTPHWLACIAMLWAWSVEANLLERYACAARLVTHLRRGEYQQSVSWQAFIKLLCRWTFSLISSIKQDFQQRMQRDFSQHFKLHGYVVFGVDGSRIELPLTSSNERGAAPLKSQRKTNRRDRRLKTGVSAADKLASVPQLWLTILYHVGLQLPWDWRSGAADSSERAQALSMLGTLPPDSLIAADAGFVGYDFSRTILQSGCELLVRVGSNIRLLKKLGFVKESHNTVYLWPDKAASKHEPPLVFRLVVMQGKRHPIYLITSVLDKNKLSDEQVIDIYKARWEIEVYYRHFKQTYGRRKLRSHKVEHAFVEAEWSLIGLWAMGLYATQEFVKHHLPLARLSVAGVLKAFRQMARDYLHPANSRATLKTLIRHSLIDTYQRKRKSYRQYHRKKKYEQPAGPPVIIKANLKQIV